MVRPAAGVLAAGLALALGTPAAWALTRPAPAAGQPVAEALAAGPAAPATSTSATSTPAATAPDPDAPPTDQAGTVPAVPTRDAAPPPPPAPVAAPARLEVSGLGITAPVDPVGVARDGSMALPADVRRVGWYRFGPAPGTGEGTVVLAGHVDDWSQGAGAMLPLRRAEPGEEVRLTDADGTTTRWRVVARETVSKKALPVDEIFTDTGPRRLVLLTCGGPFLEQYRSYADNVVVVAEPLP